MEGLKMIPYIALVIAIAGIVIGAGSVVLSKFGETVDDCESSAHVFNATYNDGFGGCGCEVDLTCNLNDTTGDNYNLTSEKYAVLASLGAQGDIAEQLPTVAIIGIMVIIISIIAGVFVYMRYFG